MENAYELIQYPTEFISFDSITKKEAEEFFQWYMAQSAERIKLLKNYVKQELDGKDIFDYTPESLVPLYDWYESHIKMVPREEEDYAREYEETEDRWKKYVSKEVFSDETYSLVVDIGYYFADIMMKEHPEIHWGYFIKPKNKMSVNSPVLLGFQNNKDLNPRLIIENCSYGFVKTRGRKTPEELYKKYKVWCKYV